MRRQAVYPKPATRSSCQDGALIGTFWKLLCMFWLNYICALRQFLCKIILLKWTTEVSQRFPYNQANTIVWKFSRLSGNFPDCPETFQTFWKLSRQLTWFKGQFCIYAQKLSGRAKTFRDAMHPRILGFSASGVKEVVIIWPFCGCGKNGVYCFA